MGQKSKWRKVQNSLRFIRFLKKDSAQKTCGFELQKLTKRVSKWKTIRNSLKFLAIVKRKKKVSLSTQYFFKSHDMAFVLLKLSEVD